MDKLTIAIADDHALLRAGLAAMIEYEEDIEVVGEAENGKDAIALYEQLRPDIMVMDVTMPEMGGIEASQQILDRFPDAKILVMTQHEEKQFIQAVLEVDVSGCINKRSSGDEFITALRTVAKGDFYLHPAMARLLAQQHRKRFIQADETLTPRELEILHAIVRGETNGQISRSLHISIKTVEWHRSNLMNKLGVHGVADLVRYAMEHGLVKEGPIDRLE